MSRLHRKGCSNSIKLSGPFPRPKPPPLAPTILLSAQAPWRASQSSSYPFSGPCSCCTPTAQSISAAATRQPQGLPPEKLSKALG